MHRPPLVSTCFYFIIGLLGFILSACTSSSDDSVVAECSNGETQTIPCGLKDQGTLEQLCVEYLWVDQGRCNDQSECFDGASRTVPKACGLNGAGKRNERCVEGRWSPVVDGEERCTDEEAHDACICIDPDVCIENTFSFLDCGLHNTGVQSAVCTNGQWKAEGPCENAWECDVDHTRKVQNACGKNGRGERVDACAEDHFWIEDHCEDPDLCADGERDERDCDELGANQLPKVQQKICEEGQWSAWSTCHDSDVCHEGDGGNFACGNPANRTGTQHRACVNGAWETSVCWQKAEEIYAGYAGFLFDGADNTVLAVGDNTRLTIGDSDLAEELYTRPVPTHAPTPQRNATRFSASSSHQCAINAQQDVRCWGLNDHGQLGAYAPTGMSADPSHVPLPASAQAIAVGEGFSCALLVNSEVHCWGLNDQHQLGRQTSASSDPTPARAFEGARLLTAGDAHVCAVRENDVYCWGENQENQASETTQPVVETPTRHTSLSYNPGRDAPPAKTDACSPVLEESHLRDLNAGARHTAVAWSTTWRRRQLQGILVLTNCRNADKQYQTHLIGVGDNARGQLTGSEDQVKSARVLEHLLLRPARYALYLSGDTTCMLSDANNETSVRCMGDNAHQQWADDAEILREITPIAVDLPDGETIASLAVGPRSVCVLLQESGRIRCRGDNTYGQLGDGTQESRGSADFVLHEDSAFDEMP